mgnify:CR=1 FL=1
MRQALVLTTHDKYHEYAYKKIFEKLGVSYKSTFWERSFSSSNEIVDIRKYTKFVAMVSKPEEMAIRRLIKLYDIPSSFEHYEFMRRI